MHDVDAHAYDEVRYEEYLERIRTYDDEESGASVLPASTDTDVSPNDAPEHPDEEAAA
jgi:hypothetical protein